MPSYTIIPLSGLMPCWHTLCGKSGKLTANVCHLGAIWNGCFFHAKKGIVSPKIHVILRKKRLLKYAAKWNGAIGVVFLVFKRGKSFRDEKNLQIWLDRRAGAL